MRGIRIVAAMLFALAVALLAGGCGGVAEERESADHLESPIDMVLAPGAVGGERIYILNGLQGSISIYNPEKDKFVRGDTDDEESPYFFEPFLFDMEATSDGRLMIAAGEYGRLYLFDPVSKESELFKLKTSPVRISCSSTSDECVLAPVGEQKVLMFNLSDLNWDEYQLDIQPLFVLYVDATIYYLCADEIAVAAASQPDSLIAEVEIAGLPQAVLYSDDDKSLYVATSDPSQLWIYDVEAESLDSVDLPEQTLATALVEVGGELYLVGAEGRVYVYLKEKQRFCGSYASSPVFTDSGPFSNPQMSEVTVRDCLVNDEVWKVKYDQDERAYVVKGEESGKQLTLAYEDQTYVSDTGSISFVIHSGDYRTTDEDMFEFRTYAGVGFIVVGLLPRAGLAWFDEEEDRWLVFIVNVLSDSISVIDADEHEIIDTLG